MKLIVRNIKKYLKHSISFNKLPRRLLKEILGGWRSKEGGTYFKVSGIIPVKF